MVSLRTQNYYYHTVGLLLLLCGGTYYVPHAYTEKEVEVAAQPIESFLNNYDFKPH